MRKGLLFGIAALGLSMAVGVARGDEKKITGVLIDQACGNKQMAKADPAKAAEGHTKACCLKCADSGYSVISGKKMYKIDSADASKAKDFLGKDDTASKNIQVTVEGDVDDSAGEIKNVKSIEKAAAKG